MQLGAIVNGDRVATPAEVEVLDPSTGGVITTTADCGVEEVDQAVRAARETLRDVAAHGARDAGRAAAHPVPADSA